LPDRLAKTGPVVKSRGFKAHPAIGRLSLHFICTASELSLMEKNLPISLKLNFTPNTLGSYGLS